MRFLTRAEGTAIFAMLGQGSESETERATASGLPRRTYQEIRRRALAEGWISERLVPDAAALGLPTTTFVLVRPYSERIAPDAAEWASHKSTVLLWETPELLFGVFQGTPPKLSAGAHREAFELHVDVRAPEVPVYFDYEGIWAKVIQAPRLTSYPTPLLGAERGQVVELSERSRHSDRLAIRRALARRDPNVLAGGPPPPPNSDGKRLIRRGLLERRVFVRLGKVPLPEAAMLNAITIVHGALVRGRRPEELFRAQVGASVFPFLFATSGGVVLFATAPTDAGAGPDPAALSVCDGILERVEATRIPLDGLAVRIDHAYGRPVQSLPLGT